MGSTRLPIGFLIAALRAGMQDLGVTRSHIMEAFDGHWHIPSPLQEVIVGFAQAGGKGKKAPISTYAGACPSWE